MYETAMLRPFKLKTTNGDKLAYYGNCNINIVSQVFDSIKNRNKDAAPFEFDVFTTYYECEKILKMKTTTHILTLNNNYFSPDVVDYTEVAASDIAYNKGTVQIIPDLNVPEVFNAFNDFIISIKNLQLKKTLASIFYNVTHGNTPYSDTDYQGEPVKNSFVYFNDDTEDIFVRLNENYPTSVNNYPQNAIILIAQNFGPNGLNTPFFFYQKNSPCKQISWADSRYTMPTYGIAIDSHGTVNFYWTTYKGV